MQTFEIAWGVVVDAWYYIAGAIALIPVGIGLANFARQQRESRPIVEIFCKSTTSADLLVEVNVRNSLRNQITLRRVSIVSPRNLDAALFHVWGPAIEPDIHAQVPPFELEIAIGPQGIGGCSFLISGRVGNALKLSIDWIDHSRALTRHTESMTVPLRELNGGVISLSDHPHRRD